MAGLAAYLTPQECLAAPMGIDLKSLTPPGNTGVAGVTSQQWYQTLKDVIYRASALIDNYLQQSLIAASHTEELDTDGRRAGVDNNGYLWLTLASFPVISVSSFQYGYPALGGPSWTIPTLTDLQVRGPVLNQILYPGRFQARNTPPLRLQITYLSGYPNTTLTASASSGVTTLAMADLTGITALQRLTIYDQGNTEQVQVSGGYIATTGAGNVTLSVATSFAHTITAVPATAPNQPYDVAVSALGPDVKQAALLVIKDLIAVRGTSALVMGKTGGASTAPRPAKPIKSAPLGICEEAGVILSPYKRIV